MMTNKQLYAAIKAHFVFNQTSFHKWCSANGIIYQNARDALLGEWTGKKAAELRAVFIKEAGLDMQVLEDQSTCKSTCTKQPVQVLQTIDK